MFKKRKTEEVFAHKTTNESYKLWELYCMGYISEEDLTEEEKRDIKAFTFAMHFLIPTDALKNFGEVSFILENTTLRRKVASYFKVPEFVLIAKLEYLLEKEKTDEQLQENNSL